MIDMETAIKWEDDYFLSKERIVLTNKELCIPGIRILATHKIKNAILPLLPHYHENAFEFTLVVNGSMSFYTSQSEYEVPGGSVFVSHPNEVHSTNNSPITVNEQYWFQLDISNPDELLFLNRIAAEDLISNLKKINRHVIATDNKEIRSTLTNGFSLAYEKGDKFMVAAYLLLFLKLLIKFSRETRYSFAPDIEKAVFYIKEHVTEELSLDELASCCNLSTSQFKQKFRHVVGTSPRNYINQTKIKLAKELLLSDISITAIAMQLGFNTSSYFSSVFKKYTMESPKDYIKRHAKKE